ncbi:hypothetical protein E2526_07380 [Salmonella enterica subsp. enterica serovar Heidelberg]|nr:hypothetical protein [Salmonella enterica subsp. enterica serovar Heidelberg]
MWLSAIHRDLPKREVTLSVDAEPITVGVANFDRMEEGQYVVVDDKENEFMLFHPEVDTTDIKDGVWLASWQDKETEKWMWAIAKQTGPTSFVLDTVHHVEPIPH